MRFAVIGEGVIDRFIEKDSVIDVIGGSGLNTAVAAKLAGLNVLWLAPEGNDELGRLITDYAANLELLQESRSVVPFRTPLVEITLNESGSPLYSFHIDEAADWQWTISDLEVLEKFDVFHLTSLSAVLQPGTEAILQFLQHSTSALIKTYDPNARPSALHLESVDFVKNRIREIVSLVDIVKVSDEDLAWIAPGIVQETAALWSTSGPRYVILTEGANGISVFVQGEKIAHIEGKAINVVDTVGAGDTVMAWILRSIENHQGLPNEDQLVEDLKLAVKAAAITCSRQGAKPPTVSEVLES